MEQKETYSKEDMIVIKVSYTEEIQRLTELKSNYRVELSRLKQENREMAKQNADLRKENTELKAKIDIPINGKEHNDRPNQIQNIP